MTGKELGKMKTVAFGSKIVAYFILFFVIKILIVQYIKTENKKDMFVCMLIFFFFHFIKEVMLHFLHNTNTSLGSIGID